MSGEPSARRYCRAAKLKRMRSVTNAALALAGALYWVGRGTPSYMGATGQIRFDEFGGAVGKQVFVGEVRP